MNKFSKAALLAGAVGLALAVSPANAQDRNGNGAYDGTESVQVIAPYFRTERSPLNGPLERVSLSTNVHYGDLNLRTRHGVRALRSRVRDAAQDVCTRIAEQYPVRQAPGTSCYKSALQNGMVRANGVIADARYDRHYY